MINQALIAAKVTPDSFQWRRFISNLLLWLGVLAIASAVMFFIAYNWDDLGRFAKFGLVQVLIAVSIFVYWLSAKKDRAIARNLVTADENATGPTNIIGQAALLSASLLLGVLLAFFGQTYQTGADTWQLFFIWAVLILPWVFISKFPVLWIVWIALVNLSAVLYFQVFRGVLDAIFTSDMALVWVIALINGAALIIWELLANRLTWLSEVWAVRTLALVSGISITSLVVHTIFDNWLNTLPLAVILWLAVMVLVYFVYRKRKPDLFMLAMACLSGLVVIISAIGYLLFDKANIDEIAGFLLMTILVITLGGFAAKWLKSVHKESYGIVATSKGDDNE